MNEILSSLLNAAGVYVDTISRRELLTLVLGDMPPGSLVTAWWEEDENE
jgi:hypothetical protein